MHDGSRDVLMKVGSIDEEISGCPGVLKVEVVDEPEERAVLAYLSSSLLSCLLLFYFHRGCSRVISRLRIRIPISSKMMCCPKEYQQSRAKSAGLAH